MPSLFEVTGKTLSVTLGRAEMARANEIAIKHTGKYMYACNLRRAARFLFDVTYENMRNGLPGAGVSDNGQEVTDLHVFSNERLPGIALRTARLSLYVVEEADTSVPPALLVQHDFVTPAEAMRQREILTLLPDAVERFA